MRTLMQHKIWFSFYKSLNDETEFYIDYRIKKVVNETGYNKEHIKLLINYLTEMYDVFSLTYSYENYMWDEYASGGNGICVEYNIQNYDYLYPVEYCDKRKIDFTKMVINSLKNGGAELAIIPWVIKNPYNETAQIDSTKEKEIRIEDCRQIPNSIGVVAAPGLGSAHLCFHYLLGASGRASAPTEGRQPGDSEQD